MAIAHTRDNIKRVLVFTAHETKEHIREPQRPVGYREVVLRRCLVTVALALIVAVGCAPDSSVGTVPSSDRTTATTAAAGTTLSGVSGEGDSGSDDRQPSSTAPDAIDVPDGLDWSAPLIGGGSIDMATFTGQQVLLWFWAPY
jgi:hypothetical protein